MRPTPPPPPPPPPYLASSQWQLQDPRLARVRFVLPTAPNMPVTLNGGMRMPAWYDLKGLGERDNESCDGIDGSAKRIGDLIAKEVASGVPENRIVLGGFSQGGALSLFSGLSHKRDVAGILVMSGYLPRGSKAAEFVRVSDVPVFHIHGDADPVVIPNWAQQTETALKGLGVKYSRKMFAGMQHEVRRDAESAAREWIIETLGLKAEGK
jgi:predicted esterase